MTGRNGGVQHGMQGVFIFVLLGLFALMSTLMVLLGAQMYRATVDRATANNENRVLSAYMRSMVRAEDAAGAVSVEDVDGVTALALREEFDGFGYVTWIYQYEDQLCEQFMEEGYEFEPDAGTAVCPVGSFEPVLEDGLLTVRMTDDKGVPCIVQVALRCAQ